MFNKENTITVLLGVGVIMFFLLLFSGTFCKEKAAYENYDEIHIESAQQEKMAKIKIKDTYTKNGVKYYIFTTDVSGDEEFTLSEPEYDTYIGLENDAVDCTIYQLNGTSDIFSYKYFLMNRTKLIGAQSLCDICDMIPDVVAGNSRSTSGTTLKSFLLTGDILSGEKESIYILNAFGYTFKDGEFELSIEPIIDYHYGKISNKVILTRYSFIGEKKFTDDEISMYKDILHKTNREIVKCCRLILAGKDLE